VSCFGVQKGLRVLPVTCIGNIHTGVADFETGKIQESYLRIVPIFSNSCSVLFLSRPLLFSELISDHAIPHRTPDPCQLIFARVRWLTVVLYFFIYIFNVFIIIQLLAAPGQVVSSTVWLPMDYSRFPLASKRLTICEPSTSPPTAPPPCLLLL